MEVLGNCNARARRVRSYNFAEPEVISAVRCCAIRLRQPQPPFGVQRPETATAVLRQGKECRGPVIPPAESLRRGQGGPQVVFGINPDLVAMVDGFCRSIPLDEFRTHGAFGPEVESTESASPTDRLMALLGRRP